MLLYQSRTVECRFAFNTQKKKTQKNIKKLTKIKIYLWMYVWLDGCVLCILFRGIKKLQIFLKIKSPYINNTLSLLAVVINISPSLWPNACAFTLYKYNSKTSIIHPVCSFYFAIILVGYLRTIIVYILLLYTLFSCLCFKLQVVMQ